MSQRSDRERSGRQRAVRRGRWAASSEPGEVGSEAGEVGSEQ